MSKEKPNLPVKFTYFRKKSARPKLRWQKISRPETSGSVSGPIQIIKPTGATRNLEKGEGSGVGPGPTSPEKQTTPANDSPEGSGSRLELVAASGPPASSVGIQSREVQKEERQTTPARDNVIVEERPSPLADAERSSVGLALEVLRQKLSERVPGFAGGGPSTPVSNLVVATSGLMVNVASIATSGSPEESVGAQSRKAPEVARQTLPEWNLVFIGQQPSPPASAQNLPASVPGFAGEKPSPPVPMIPNQIGFPSNFHGCQRSLASGSACPTPFVCSPGWAETQAKDTVLQMVPGELSLAVNSESMDDELCYVLMSSQVGEDEARLAVQPLNVLYPSAENELGVS
ncbi:hypothetical protein FH972_027223 [Carpinus fangiana]|uniref:Uncharacterized protein n=1 Tax=Carpinus fangiana TaxID=176857 RepID=A0A5N6L6J3_9ROSI|nr:hypothetical protein FH972_027223 [Carpinus fangiana]